MQEERRALYFYGLIKNIKIMELTAQMKSIAYDNDGMLYCVSVSRLRAKKTTEFLQAAKEKLKSCPNIHRVRVSYTYYGMKFEVKIERCEVMNKDLQM